MNLLPRDEILTVSLLNRLVREAIEGRFPLCWVSGEVSAITRAASGHIYFSLKDERAQVRCTFFRNRAQLLPFRLEQGMRVDVRALVTLFEARGEFQLNVESVRRAGIGALYEAFVRLRERLEREGLFDIAHKRKPPRYPRRVGIVTSLHAAALHDIVAAMRRRAPNVILIVYVTPVQGEGAAPQIAARIDAASRRGECDVLIVARGGGSIEDLWAFNDEAVARAVRTCSIPVVSGVGHETDVTIVDLVADQRAATPTAAAELVSAGFHEAGERLQGLGQRMDSAARRALSDRAQQLDALARRLVHPARRLAPVRAHVAHLASRLQTSAEYRMERASTRFALIASRLRRAAPQTARLAAHSRVLEHRLKTAARARMQDVASRLGALGLHLDHLDPHAVLRRGYSITRDARGRVVRSASGLAAGEDLSLEFAQGGAHVRVVRTADD